MKDCRCVHLDFHTSELIEGVGKFFDADDFKKKLQDAKIDSITLFAKCHHGCFYYEDTNFFKHPYLCGSLLDKQVQACKEIGVSAKIYISAGLDEHVAKEHPDWIVSTEVGVQPPNRFFRRLCMNTPYLDLLKAQTEEVVKKYQPDGVFFDIVGTLPCYCDRCLADMEKKGLDKTKEEDAIKQAQDVFQHYLDEMNKTVRAIKPDCLIFHNAGNFSVGGNDLIDACDQLETEALPTGSWRGYDHFPLSISYIRRKGKNCIGMTGKFHKNWGEFGAYKYKDALKYEAAQSLALDAGFSIGDQLHPTGIMDAYTYESIAYVNEYIVPREKWRGGSYLAEAALYSPEEDQARYGSARILFEEKILFDLIEEEEISNRYKLIVLPFDRELTRSEYIKLKAYVKGDGKLLAMGKNVCYDGNVAFDLGAQYCGEDVETPCYIRANYPLRYADKMPLVAYEKAYNVSATGRVLAEKISPYFKREGARFCSHMHTPCDYNKISAAITEGADGIYLASDLFTQYAIDGSLTAKQLIAPLLDRLLGERKIVTNLPSSGKVAVYEKEGRTVCHLWYANTIKRGDGVEVIEDIVTLSKVNVSLKMDESPKKVVLQPEGVDLDFTYKNGRVEFSIKDFNCYHIVEMI